MARFGFIYYVKDGAHEVAEIEGVCEVDRNGAMDISLYVVGDANKTLVPAGRFREEIVADLLVRYIHELADANKQAIRDAREHDREVAHARD